MHATARQLLRIRPLPVSELVGQKIRLSPAIARSAQAKQPSAQVKDRNTFNKTIQDILQKRERQTKEHEATTTVEASAGEGVAVMKERSIPDNFRVEVADKKKTAFWNVPKDRRRELLKVLRES